MPYGVTSSSSNPVGVVQSSHSKFGIVQPVAYHKSAKMTDPHKKQEVKVPVKKSQNTTAPHNSFEKLAMN